MNFSFNFSSVSVDDTDLIPVNQDLTAIIRAVSYKNLTPKGQPTDPSKDRLAIKQDVFVGKDKVSYETLISPAQAWLMKQYLEATGLDSSELDDVSLDEGSLRSALVNQSITIHFVEKEWKGKMYKNVKYVRLFQDLEEPLPTGSDIPEELVAQVAAEDSLPF